MIMAVNNKHKITLIRFPWLEIQPVDKVSILDMKIYNLVSCIYSHFCRIIKSSVLQVLMAKFYAAHPSLRTLRR